MLTPYFSLENVQSGVFFLANRLYGITFRPVAVPVYHPDVTAYEVLDADESHLGVLYFDYFPREGKSQGAWCGNYVEQTYDGQGRRVAPVVSIVANFTRPTRSTPALLTLDETATLFHEFGHALHFLFHDVKYRGLSEVEGDFVELPSQVMENWAFEPEMLKQYAVHYRTNEVIPRHLVEKLRRSVLFNQGFQTTELIAAALADMDIHSAGDYEPFDVEEFGRRALNEKRGLIPDRTPLPLSLFQPHFRRRLFGRLLLLHLGRSARQGCVRSVPRERRPFRQAYRSPLPPAAVARRLGGRHDALPHLSRKRPRQDGHAGGPRLDGASCTCGRFAGCRGSACDACC